MKNIKLLLAIVVSSCVLLACSTQPLTFGNLNLDDSARQELVKAFNGFIFSSACEKVDLDTLSLKMSQASNPSAFKDTQAYCVAIVPPLSCPYFGDVFGSNHPYTYMLFAYYNGSWRNRFYSDERDSYDRKDNWSSLGCS